MVDIKKFSEEMKTLREFIETEKAKREVTERDSTEQDTVLERLEKEDFMLIEYDYVVVRQLIEKVTVESKDTITVQFKGGFEVKKSINNELENLAKLCYFKTK